MTPPLRVLQIIDSLATGGSEQMAVRLANSLDTHVDASFLCATRKGGPLHAGLSADVTYWELGRRGSLDMAAAKRLSNLIRQHGINIVHAHSTSIYLGAVAVLPVRARTALILHDHNSRLEERRRWLTRAAASLSDRVLTASSDIARWNTDSGVPARKVSVVPNFVDERFDFTPPALPGHDGARVVHVANVRPEKNHLGLIRAFAAVVTDVPAAHLLLVGSLADAGHVRCVRAEIERRELSDHVSMLGVRTDIAGILAACDVGVLPSTREGGPVALIEYGQASLPVVATSVGQVPSMTGGGTAAVLVEPGDDPALAAAIVTLLTDPESAATFGRRLSEVVAGAYSADVVLPGLVDIYATALQERS